MEIGVLLPLLVVAWIRPTALSRPVRFWIFLSAGLLLPLLVRSPLYNDVAMRGAMPAQLAAVFAGYSVLYLQEQQWRGLVITLAAFQLVLATLSGASDFYLRFTQKQEIVPQTSV